VAGTYIYAVLALVLVVAGMTIGILVMIGLGIKRDDRPGGFPADTDDRAARAARRVIGVGARSAELTDKASRRQDILPV
jgi:hypothetical protein